MRKTVLDLGSTSICEVVENLKQSFDQGKLPQSLTDERYFNIKRMQSITLVSE